MDVLVRLVSRHSGGRGLERQNSRHRFVPNSGDEEDVARVPRRIITAANKKLNEMRAEAAAVGDAESALSGDNDTSDEDSE